MPLKSWILDKMNRVNELLVRDDLPPAAETGRPPREALPAGERREPVPVADAGEHLGIYRPLVDAIRAELEHFVAAHLRHHLAIAEHDRFLLTTIGIAADEGGEPLELLRRFTREFRPEQIRRFLMRELIGALPQAQAIDLSQFAGLSVPGPGTGEGEEKEADEYAELLAALGSGGPEADRSAYRVSLGGRWIAGEPPAPAPAPAAAGVAAVAPADGSAEFELHDAGGGRSVALPRQPGRRLVVGKEPGCELVAEGTYVSRRHCELWFEQGAWWVRDLGSTNGIRVESLAAGVRRSRAPGAGTDAPPIRLAPGERLVLSAQAEGPPRDHPWLALQPEAGAPPTPIAAAPATPATPITPIVAPVAPAGRRTSWAVTLRGAGGERVLALDGAALPASVGRSRSCTLGVDRAHESVSGHHLDIVALDPDGAGAELRVLGTNGVTLDGVAHGPGRLRWRPGQVLQLGRPAPGEPPCTLELERRADAPAPSSDRS